MQVKELCSCGSPAKWAEDATFPIEYDSQTGEYNVVHGMSGKGRWRMLFCPSCGGRLPESRRSAFFTTPSDEEKQEVARLLERIHDPATLQQVLGDPDEVAEWSETGEAPWDHYGVRKWKRQLTYQKRWRTLVLTAFQGEDDSITFSISGRHL
jgi:hypothetical protein